ncbi:MAG: 2-isopropylmalate synthase [Acidobacteria bacterium]|jgi:2-isopropylmalate synthase|nr:2-isopropylmalate synthase [Acidobacteriota bacterium]
MPKESKLIYDWNLLNDSSEEMGPVEFNDETLRDGIQSPSARDPNIENKLQILHLMDSLGINSASLGLPGASDRQRADVKRLAEEIRDESLGVSPNCAARTVITDIEPIIEVADEVGIPIEVACFIGSSPIRQYAEDWTLDTILRHSENAVEFAVDRGMPVMFVTEDTTRTTPETIARLYTVAIEAGARRICVCDTVGHATPPGVRALINFVSRVVAKTGEEVAIDWHGHEDRSLGVWNALAALEAGASRAHATAFGIGERCGNTAMDQLLINCCLLGWSSNDLSKLSEYCKVTSEAIDIPIPSNHPVIGADAFRTGTGVHAAAVIKASKKGDHWLADRIYSGVPASMVGRQQKIEVGPMSGASNVEYRLHALGIAAHPDRVEAVLAAAKNADHVLDDEEIQAALEVS